MFISYLNEDVERRRWSCPIPLNKDITHSGRDFKVSVVYECIYNINQIFNIIYEVVIYTQTLVFLYPLAFCDIGYYTYVLTDNF